MAKFKLQPGEQLIMEGSLPYVKSKLQYVAGSAYLTDQRFVHTNNLRARAVGGLLGALMSSGRIDLEIPLGSIERISRSTHGRKNDPVLVITTGGSDHRLVAPFEQWFEALSHTLATHRATTMVELGPGAWQAIPIA